MTLHDVQRIYEHWKVVPPASEMLRACAQALGVKLPEPALPESAYMTAEELKRLVDATGGKIEGVGRF